MYSSLRRHRAGMPRPIAIVVVTNVAIIRDSWAWPSSGPINVRTVYADNLIDSLETIVHHENCYLSDNRIQLPCSHFGSNHHCGYLF